MATMTMIARLWSARTTNPDAYEALFPTDALAHLTTVDGFRGAYLLRSEHELLTITMFDSLDAVRRFAGPDYLAANVSAAARAVLDDVDERVRHFAISHSWSR